MPAVNDIRRKAQIDGFLFHLSPLLPFQILQPVRHQPQILLIIDLRAQGIPHVQRRDPGRALQRVQRVFGIDPRVSAFTE